MAEPLAFAPKGPSPLDFGARAPNTAQENRGNILSPIVQGLTFGFGDEMAARVRSAAFGTDYQTELAKSRGMLDDIRQRAPIASTVAEIGGAVAPMLATGGMGLAARAGTATARAMAGGRAGATAAPAVAAATGRAAAPILPAIGAQSTAVAIPAGTGLAAKGSALGAKAAPAGWGTGQTVGGATGGATSFVTNAAPAVSPAAPGILARAMGSNGGRLALAGAEGAAGGAAYGFGTGEGGLENRLDSAAVNAVLGGAGGAAGAAILNKFGPGIRSARESIPTTEGLKDAKNAAYASADAADVILRPTAVRQLQRELVDELAKAGYSPRVQKFQGIKDVLGELKHLSGQNVTWQGIENVRRIAGSTAKSPDDDVRRIGSLLTDRISRYMDTVPASQVLMGNIDQAQAGVREGRMLNSRYRRSELVDTQMTKAGRRAASTGSGGNTENAVRQKVAEILNSDRLSRGMTAGEKAAAEDVVRGTPSRNAARWVGNTFAPKGPFSFLTGLGSGSMVTQGLGSPMIGAGVSATVMGGGLLAKGMAERGTVRAARELSERVRSGGQTAREIAQGARRGVGSGPVLEGARKQRVLERRGIPAAGIAVPSFMESSGY